MAKRRKKPKAPVARRKGSPARQGKAGESPGAGLPRSVISCRPGPWGPLEYFHAYLEAPEPLINQLSLPSNQTVWHFEEMSVESIERILDAAQFTPSEIQSILDPRKRTRTGNVIRIFPDREIVKSLSPVSRAGLYRVLSRSELNTFHHSPIVLDPADLSEAFQRTQLPFDLVQRIIDLSFTEMNVTMFSDFPVLLHYLTHPRQERQLIRILTRTRTILAHLSLDEGIDTETLAGYWAPSERQTNTRAFIESVARTPGIRTLDLAHLFPPVPRSQLFTYPNLGDCLSGRAPDGTWTSLNFFSNQPLGLHLTSEQLGHHISSRFQQVAPPFQFGDMLVIAPLEGPRAKKMVHSCTFIADNLCYTKNSPDLRIPWTIATLEEVVTYQVRGLPASVTGYRLKAFTE